MWGAIGRATLYQSSGAQAGDTDPFKGIHRATVMREPRSSPESRSSGGGVAARPGIPVYLLAYCGICMRRK